MAAVENIAYDWLTNLSGQDFPIASLAGFAERLDKTDADSSLHHFDAIEQDPASMRRGSGHRAADTTVTSTSTAPGKAR